VGYSYKIMDKHNYTLSVSVEQDVVVGGAGKEEKLSLIIFIGLMLAYSLKNNQTIKYDFVAAVRVLIR